MSDDIKTAGAEPEVVASEDMASAPPANQPTESDKDAMEVTKTTEEEPETVKKETTAQPETSGDLPPSKPAPLQTASFKKPVDVKPQMSPEKMEEMKFSAKYGKSKPGGSDFLRKRLNKGVKYFDSGDYNMEKQSGKMKLRPGSGKPSGIAGSRLGGGPIPATAPIPGQSPLGATTGKTIPTPQSIPHRKQSTEISKLAV